MLKASRRKLTTKGNPRNINTGLLPNFPAAMPNIMEPKMAPTVRREEIHVLSVLSDLYCLSNGVLLASSRIVRTGEDQVKQVPHTKDISWAEK